MSLISDALKKVEAEREKFKSQDQVQDHQPERKPLLTRRNYLFAFIVFAVIIASVFATLFLYKKPVVQLEKQPLITASKTSTNVQDNKNQPEGSSIRVNTNSSAAKEEKKELNSTMKDEVKGQAPRTSIKVKNITPEKPDHDQKEKKSQGETDFQKLVDQGDRYSDRQDFISASLEYKAALRLKPNLNVFLKLYSCYKGMNNKILARAYVDEGLKHYPDNFSLNKISAILFIRERNFKKALVNIENSLKTNSSDYSLYTYRGLCLFHLKEFNKAESSFIHSLKINNNAVENFYYIGLIYDNLKKFKEALINYKKFLNHLGEQKYFKHKNWVTIRIRVLERSLYSNSIRQNK